MLNNSISDEVNRQSNAIAKRREQLRRWDESETNRESSKMKLSQRVKFEQAYIFLAACSSEDRDDIDKLLQRGVDINTSNIDGLTALHQSCIDNNFNMVEYLLNKNADINCVDNEGWTPLHAAASCANIDIVKYLLSRGAFVDPCNNEGELPIDIAEDEQIISILEDDMRIKGIDDQQSRNYEHQLMIKHAQDYFKSSTDSIVHTRTGATALHVAAAKGYFDVIEILIRSGANINCVDNDGWTPLHAAAHWDQHDIIKYLIEKHADLDAKNDAGQTPFDVCDGQTFELLKQLKDKYPPTPIKIKSPSSIIPDESSDHLKEKLNNFQRSFDDLNHRYSKPNEKESFNNCQRIFTNPLQSLSTPLFHFYNNKNSFNSENSPNNCISSESTDTKINRRWGPTDRTVDENVPYVRRRSGVEMNNCYPSTSISVTSSNNYPTANLTVTTNDESKKRMNRDEEAEAQRKHRSAQARRERRSTQSVTVEDIKAAEEQMKSQINELSNNKIGAPSTPLSNNEHDIDTQHLQKLIQDNKDHRIQLNDHLNIIYANDSLNLQDNQQQKRINYQTKNTGRIIWNDQTKEVEIKDQQRSISRFDQIRSNGINSNRNQFYEDMKINIEQLNHKIQRLEKDLFQRDQIVEKLKTSQYIESSLDKREKRSYERKIAELEEESKKMDSIKSDNTRLKEENAALIRVISKLSK